MTAHRVISAEHTAGRGRVIQTAMAGPRLEEIEDNEGSWTRAEIAEYDQLPNQLSRLPG